MSNKRVHEIAKERGLPAKDVLARLKAAGVDVKAASSSVDEEVASRVLANGGQARSASGSAGSASGSGEKAKPAAEKPKAKSADGARAAKPAERPKGEASAKPAEKPKAAARGPGSSPRSGGRERGTRACRRWLRRCTPPPTAGGRAAAGCRAAQAPHP